MLATIVPTSPAASSSRRCPRIHAARRVDADGSERQTEDLAKPGVGVVRLARCEDALAGMQTACDPQGFEIRDRAAAGQVAERAGPAIQAGDRRDAFLLERGTCTAAVEGMVVRVDPQRQGVSNPGDGMRGFQHLPGVQGMMVRIVVLQSPCRLLEHRFSPLHVELGLVRRQVFEAAGKAVQGTPQQVEFGSMDHGQVRVS